MADGSVFGLIHDLQDRRRARKIRDARRNYLSDPLESIQQVHELDPDMGLALRNDYQNVLKERQTNQLEAQKREQERVLGAARNITQGLMRVRDEGGDVAAAFEQTAPILQNGFGMGADEIEQWRSRITTNPASLDSMYRMLNEPTEAESKLYDIAPGARLVDHEGNEIAAAPALPKSVTLRGGDGSEHLFVIDENGNLIEGGGASGAPGVASVPGNVNPQARGMRNMNPGNIKDGPWAQRQPGYAGSDGTFARFNSLEAGTAAQERLLEQNYVNGQRNLTQIVDKYLGFTGPGGENSQASRDNYIQYVAGQIGVDPSAPVPPAMLPQLAQAMREFETGGGTPARGGSGLPGRPIASTPGKPVEPEGWRNMTPEEVAAAPGNLDPNRSYQIGLGGANKGRIVQVPGQPSPGKGPNGGKPGELTMQQHYTAVTAAQKVRDEARALQNHPSFEQATGSIQGRLPSIFQRTVDFDDKLDAFVSDTVVNALLHMKQNSPNGATGFGQLNMQEGNWIKQAEGSFKQTSPEELKRSLERHERDAMITIGMVYNIPPEATMLLLQNPKLAGKFDEKFGADMAKKIMGE